MVRSNNKISRETSKQMILTFNFTSNIVIDLTQAAPSFNVLGDLELQISRR